MLCFDAHTQIKVHGNRSSEEGTLEDVGHVGFLMLAHYAITRSRRHKQISAEHSYAMLKLSTLLDQN